MDEGMEHQVDSSARQSDLPCENPSSEVSQSECAATDVSTFGNAPTEGPAEEKCPKQRPPKRRKKPSDAIDYHKSVPGLPDKIRIPADLVPKWLRVRNCLKSNNADVLRWLFQKCETHIEAMVSLDMVPSPGNTLSLTLSLPQGTSQSQSLPHGNKRPQSPPHFSTPSQSPPSGNVYSHHSPQGNPQSQSPLHSNTLSQSLPPWSTSPPPRMDSAQDGDTKPETKP